MSNVNHIQKAKELGVCVLIPVYNNSKTIAQVIEDVKQYCTDILVVVDGSTDGSNEIVNSIPDISVLSYTPNAGKGIALRRGLKEIEKMGFNYAISIDSDGQHFAKDIPVFLDAIEKSPDTLFVGARIMKGQNQAKKSSFANKFSNFWYFVDTLHSLPDTQSGYRLYPVKTVNKIFFFSTKYEFEVEVLVKATWRGIPVKPVEVSVYYPPAEERVSFFRPGPDFTRISILNTYLLIMAVFYGHWMVIFRALQPKNIANFLRKQFLDPNEPIHIKAASVGFGIFMGIIPIWGWQMIVATVLSHFLKLNKGIVLLSSNISFPPLIPIIVYISLFFGKWINFNDEGDNIIELIQSHEYAEAILLGGVQYLVGSTIFAVIAGISGFIISYPILKIVFRDKGNSNPN